MRTECLVSGVSSRPAAWGRTAGRTDKFSNPLFRHRLPRREEWGGVVIVEPVFGGGSYTSRRRTGERLLVLCEGRTRSETLGPGYRNRADGTLYNVGQNGYSWSSSVPAAGSNAYFLNFNNTGVNPQNSNSRANGLQVRCLQAFIGAFRSLCFTER